MRTRFITATLLTAQSALGQGRIQFQVSPALQENWSSSLDVLPGQAVDLRAVISYTGAQSPIGLAAVLYQPALSNWDADGPSTDAILPFVDHGGALTVPPGDVPDSPGQYGRVRPFGYVNPGDNHYAAFHNVANGVSYLRISTSNHSNWVGEAGNTTGGGGVNTGQPPQWVIERNPDYPYPFNTDISDLVVLKLGVVLSNDTNARTLIFGAAEAFAQQPPNGNTSFHWYASSSETIGSITGPAEYIPAEIHVVPSAPSVAALAGAILLASRRRRPCL